MTIWRNLTIARMAGLDQSSAVPINLKQGVALATDIQFQISKLLVMVTTNMCIVRLYKIVFSYE